MQPPAFFPLYSVDQVRELDRIAIQGRGIPGIRLMKRAGEAVLRALLKKWPSPDKITVYCGSGNNGGDGYIVAALARGRGIPVEVVQVAPAAKLSGDARRAYEFALAEGVVMEALLEHAEFIPVPDKGVIVDALLGTGLSGEVRDPFARVIDAINLSGLPVVAVDIPSGVCGDSGRIFGRALRCQMTVTFIGRKRGLYTGSAPAYCGARLFDDLAVPSDIYEQVKAPARLLAWQPLSANLPTRAADAHKGLFGHVLCVGGDCGFGGAVAMAAEAALRTGAGLVSVATRPEHVPALIARCPEIMAVGVNSGQELEPLLEKASVLVVGPGLGRSPWSEQLLQKALASGLPMVLDADGLNILNESRIGGRADLSRTLMTPHPGEAGRLLGVDSHEIQGDRFAAVRALQQKFAATVLLKGAGTLIADAESVISLCPYGNPGMAVGGMGDVLSGILGALMAQGLPSREAAETGACLHALAADDAVAVSGQIGLCATDLMPLLRHWRNKSALQEMHH
jgi:NAD(P)H-hydrate epimerase